jgi:hypothetical protein
MESRGKRWSEISNQIPTIWRDVKAWQAQEWQAGRPCSLKNYCAERGVSVCPACQGMGVRIVDFEWDQNGEDEQNGEMVPTFDFCNFCGGTGR